jgi:hypothetical protein
MTEKRPRVLKSIFNYFIAISVGVNWNSRSEIDTAYTDKCDVALNNKQVLRKCLKALDKVHVKTF